MRCGVARQNARNHQNDVRLFLLPPRRRSARRQKRDTWFFCRQENTPFSHDAQPSSSFICFRFHLGLHAVQWKFRFIYAVQALCLFSPHTE
jgi:hypothetical protein